MSTRYAFTFDRREALHSGGQAAHRAEIDGLRALAVIQVILFHAGFGWCGGGYVGVDVFFVISGYLITTIILNAHHAGRFSIAEFYERRARRILPALFVVLLLCLIPAWLWMMPAALKNFSQSLVAVAVFGSNLFFWRTRGYFDEDAGQNLLIHTWSLGVEEQYYLFFPFFVILAARFAPKRMFWLVASIACVSLALSQYAWRDHGTANFYLAPTRAWELLLGSLLAFVCLRVPLYERVSKTVNQWLSLLGLGLIIGSIVFYSERTPFPSIYALAPTVGAALILGFANEGTWVSRLLSRKWMVGIGLISYSAYLWHQPLFAFARIYSLNEPSHVTFTLLSALTLVLAFLTWRYVETPFRDRRRYSRKAIFSASLLASCGFIAIGLVGYKMDGFPRRLSTATLQLMSYADYYRARVLHGRCNIPDGYRELSKECVVGAKGHSPSMALIGDSYAEALADELGKSANKKHLAFWQFTADDCLPIMGTKVMNVSGDYNCPRLTADWIKFIDAQQNIRTVIMSANWAKYVSGGQFDNGEGGKFDSPIYAEPTGKNWSESNRINMLAESVSKEIHLLLNANKTVILIYPIPQAGWNVPEYEAKSLWRHDAEALMLSTSYSVQKQRNTPASQVLDAIGNSPNLVRIRPMDILCNSFIKGRCAVTIKGVPLYYDMGHLSNDGARMLVSEIAKHLSAAS